MTKRHLIQVDLAGIERKKRSAMESCKIRNHVMGSWKTIKIGTLFESRCNKCNKWVRINMNPRPNEIDIGGPAVAVTCKD